VVNMASGTSSMAEVQAGTSVSSQAIDAWVSAQPDRLDAIAQVRQWLHELSPCKTQPVDLVIWIPLEQIEPNDYNPNKVAQIEMGLLLTSIQHDGYTQPVVTIYDEERDKYVIVDGFHRYYVMVMNQGVRDSTDGLLPCVVIDNGVGDCMASTVRYNRARGKHTVEGMSSLVFGMLDTGLTDAQVCNELGMEPEELLRLKHITGFSKLFADVQYKQAWVTRSQVIVKQKALAEEAEKQGS